MANFTIDFNGFGTGGNATTSYNDSTTTNPTVVLFSSAAITSANNNNANDRLKTLVLNISNPEATMAFGGLGSNFSVSFNSTTGNITITYIGGSGGATSTTWNAALQSMTYFNSNDESPTTHTITFVSATPASGSYTSSTAANFDTINVICFMAGTLVRTPDGEVAVETLKRGDLVLTTDGVAKPVRWLGRQTVSSFFADPARSYPIRVKAGALAENVPSRDLLVSPDHALLVDGVMVHAGALVNGTSIVREAKVPTVFTYHHVELDDHSLILAENTPAETFVDNVDRMNFDNWAEHQALYPEGRTVSELPYPRAKAHRQVPVYIRVALAERAEIIGAVKSAVA
ncbi:Hint domain-containing protein [Rhodoblastus sp. 17X3]|uniref:Hint domain-containing protein n=1 Tax=Rhodoblastus sp. 17X3 TaxID=3047026 RepID=UPI0024B76B0D|nr:Hint domain-containing protein [Rhodoblastus sp. 17X3]MDI9849819.1 Hint domain-containing protein [Rhodoblastus sp. 17X3]